MRYEKPQLHEVTNALKAIQSDQTKLIHRVSDGTMTLGETAAYEADE